MSLLNHNRLPNMKTQLNAEEPPDALSLLFNWREDYLRDPSNLNTPCIDLVRVSSKLEPGNAILFMYVYSLTKNFHLFIADHHRVDEILYDLDWSHVVGTLDASELRAGETAIQTYRGYFGN